MISASASTRTRCCIAGGGPAGMVLGYLLARAGVPVVVLEKHADFLRDFRGDTVHPSTLEIMHELGLLDAFLMRPHQKIQELNAVIGGKEIAVADFSHLPLHCKFIALMPQWDFLNFIAEQAKQFPHFALCMETRAVELVEKDGKVTGLRAESNDGPQEISANLVVAADGRHSDLRRAAGLEVIDRGAPIDVLWMRLPRHPDDPEATGGRFATGHILVMINRGDYWQCAFVVPKNGYEAIRSAGLDAFRREILSLAPFAADRIAELNDWDKIKLLTVTVNRLKQWSKPGFLCIGDAAHAMSPVGGVGINLAIQDAVAAANLLAQPLRGGAPSPDALASVQRRREWPTKMTQSLQIFIQNNILAHALSDASPKNEVPFALKAVQRLPFLRRIPARVFGMGFRPEHAAPFLRKS
ncbi:FAD-dependent oxidoreductase [Paracidobacterium acidisoli]|uniref:FAD-dependent oxidoreductase n=1 Tax=Paracidobacterium acidisoli TaxID=2303751 RepID=A0A372IT36_9BACT|nr:FAD-dependent oxidoreductase [Paracidobacterium acidisoli]MBT9329503.1 FAD-dependent oxidoreductase [Paracidobacterium acidisoli]